MNEQRRSPPPPCGDAAFRSAGPLARPLAGPFRELRTLAHLLRPHWGLAAAGMVAVLAAAVLQLVIPYLAKVGIDDGIKAGDRSVVLHVGAGVALVTLALGGLRCARTRWFGVLGNRAATSLQFHLVDHVLHLDLDDLRRMEAGPLLSRVTNDVGSVRSLLTSGLPTLIRNVAQLVGTVVAMLWLDFDVTLMTLATLPVLGAVSMVYRRGAAPAFATARDTLSEVTSYGHRTLSLVHHLRRFNQEERHVREFAEVNSANAAAELRINWLEAMYYPSTGLLSAGAKALLIVYGGTQVVRGEVATGTMIAFLGYLQGFFTPLRSLAQVFGDYQQGVAAASKVFTVLHTGKREEISDAPVERSSTGATVVLDAVSGTIGGRAVPIEGVSLEMPAGSSTAIVGEARSGRATLAGLLAGLGRITGGRLQIDGVDIRDIPLAELRSRVAYITAMPRLFAGTVRENVALARPDASDAELTELLAGLAGDDFLSGLGAGLDTEIGKDGCRLSAGQRQLVGIARSLLTDASIVVFDDATYALDAVTEADLLRVRTTVLAGRTVVVVTSRMGMTELADRVAVLDGGRIAEQGPPAELLAQGGAYARLHRHWHRDRAQGIRCTADVAMPA